MLYLLRFVHKFIISNSLYLLPNKLLVFGLQITHRAGKKYGIAILLKTKKRYKFFIHYWLYFSKLRFEATFVLKVVAELLDFFNQQGKLYKFIMSIYQIAWDNRFVKPKRK